ncbi:uncharacterized protein LOC105221534 [Zeugodacus cucurbitae]|uniref:Cationic amino acid transporter 1 n=1 Tax=Zeugodacus cucurbitae TaxID=28588 RepID=A0A0A1WY68_ZEUCU|nr:uncharacterized protein LOC105221534 [Zeugodacus cucurbitae]
MKRFNCFSLRSFGIVVAGFDIIVGLCTLALCSYYLWTDYVQVSYWPQDEVKILSPLSNFIAIVVDYVLVHNFSNAFYMVLAVTIWIKSLINLVVASILMDGIRKQRLVCIAPWLINTSISIGIEIAVFVFMEIKMNEFEEEIALDRRIVHSVIFGVFMVFNALSLFGISALYKMLKATVNENRTLQESIVEAAGLYQHVKV